MEKVLYIIAHNIRSAYNIGAIFRTADGAGAKKIFLTGYSPTPFNSSVEVYPTQAQKMIAKTALGAEKYIAWEKRENVANLINELKSEGIEITALENNTKAVDYKKTKYFFPIALLLGQEVEGVSNELLEMCDKMISIPMRGQKESLNVSVAAGIAVYEILQ